MRRLDLLFLILLTGCCSFLGGCFSQRSFNPEDLVRAEQLIDDGVAFLRKESLVEAEESFNLAREIYPMAAAYDGLGCVALLRGHYQAAESWFWQAYEMDASYNNALGNLALLYEIRGRTEEARKLYLRALDEDPANYRARNNYAAYLSDNGAAGEAVYRHLLKARALYNHPLIYDNIKKVRKMYETVD